MGRFWSGLLVGLVAGLLLGVGGAEGLRRMHADPWIEAGGEWERLPGHVAAGALPQTFTVPAKAWDYGATTKALPSVVTEAPAIVRVDLAQVKGKIGVSLAKPDGSALISKERTLAPGDAPVSVYFRSPGLQPVSVLVRNYGAEGVAGSVSVKGVKYAREADLSKKDLGEVNKAGLD